MVEHTDAKVNRDEYRSSMSDFIAKHFADVLGSDIKFLQLPHGYDLIYQKYCGDYRSIAA